MGRPSDPNKGFVVVDSEMTKSSFLQLAGIFVESNGRKVLSMLYVAVVPLYLFFNYGRRFYPGCIGSFEEYLIEIQRLGMILKGVYKLKGKWYVKGEACKMGYIDFLFKAMSLCPCKWSQLVSVSSMVNVRLSRGVDSFPLVCRDGLKTLLLGYWAFLL